MIVRERRRVAALARTASLLDERVQVAEKALAVNDAALRSFIEEHRQEVADLEQRQHDQILCLIDMVKEGSSISDMDPNADSTLALFQKELLVLANERVSV
jgi:ABC-type transporter Mla subunit MlaD